MRISQRVSTDKIYNYQGSLTAPPCTESVNWIILDDPRHISTRQIENFQNLWEKNKAFAGGNGNNRVAQPLNGRKIFYKVNEQLI